MNNSIDHSDLIQGCLKGSRKHQYQLYAQYSKAMYNVCLRIMNDDMLAEDVLQESFVDVFTKIHTFKYESTPGAWIKRIVVNNCINKLRKNKLHLESLEEEHTGIAMHNDAYDESSAYKIKDIKRAMNQLPDGYRTIFSLYALEGYDHQEIGSILGISESTSKSQYSRAKKKIKALINTI